MDDFLKDLAQAEKSRDLIRNGLEERKQKNALGDSDMHLESKMRGWLKDFAMNFDALQNQLDKYHQNPEKSRMTSKELDRRTALVEELEKDLNELEAKVKAGNKPAAAGVGVNFRREGSEENESTKNLSNRDLQVAQDTMWKKQSELEDAILGTTGNLVSVSHNLKDELDLQDGLLDDLTQGVDHTQKRIDKSNFRMKELIYKSSDCCLITVILILIGVVMLIIFLL